MQISPATCFLLVSPFGFRRHLWGISGSVYCSQFCSQPDGLNSTQWTRYEYMESENSELNSIAG